MKRLIIVLALVALGGLAAVAMSGDFHKAGSLFCSDCHVAHFSQGHVYQTGDSPTTVIPLDDDGPHHYLLRKEENHLCLTCHNANGVAPDVFGANTGKYQGTVRRAGGLNSFDTGQLDDGADYEAIDGHSLWSDARAPGGTWSNSGGLVCTDCHAQHGHQPAQFRNLRTSTRATDKFYNANLTYNVNPTPSATDSADITITAVRTYTDDAVWYNEPDQTKSAYATWCGACHTNFHGTSGSANMKDGSAWVRHPVADVNIGSPGGPHISSYAQYNNRTNKVKVLGGKPTGPAATTVTPSCMSCHKSHGNKNGFGLIYMSDVGSVTEEGTATGVYVDMCKQCHIQG